MRAAVNGLGVRRSRGSGIGAGGAVTPGRATSSSTATTVTGAGENPADVVVMLRVNRPVIAPPRATVCQLLNTIVEASAGLLLPCPVNDSPPSGSNLPLTST